MSGRDSVIVSKLKEGLQDAIVYLRMLEGAKLAPIYERKRKQVMEKLLDLQGEGRREAPPVTSSEQNSVEEEPGVISSLEESPVKKRHSGISSEGDDEDGSRLVRRNSKLLGLMNKFEQSDESRSFKYKTLEELKKGKQADQQKKDGVEGEKKEEEVENPEPEEPEVEENTVEELEEEDEELEQPVIEDTVEEKSRSRAITQGFGKFKKLFKSSKDKDKPYAVVPEPQAADEQEEKEAVEVEEPKEEGKDIKLSTQLDRVTKRLGSTYHQRVHVTLRTSILTIAKNIKGEDSKEIVLSGTSVTTKDAMHFELHCEKKTFVFRADCEESCQQWVEALQGVIVECSPEQVEEEKSSPQTSVDGEAAPQITVSVDNESSPGPAASLGGNIRESVSTENLSKKKEKKKKQAGPEMPPATVVTMKGILYQKATFSWDKRWCVFTTDNTLYVASSESSQRPNAVLAITTDSKVQRRNGPDKYRHAVQVQVVPGGKKELFATDSESDFTSWIGLLEQAAGCAQIQELLSEDEEDGEFYEDLAGPTDAPPKVPASPRPAHASFEPTAVPEEDDNFDDDIYEAPDEVDMSGQSSLSVPVPSLPPRNEPKTQGPSLPPRSVPASTPGPSLPPRGVPSPSLPARNPVSKVKAPAPPPVDDEVYDDVVGHDGEMEETYDDVVVGEDGPEETYDDVEVQGGGVMEELYEELESDLPTQPPPPPEEEQEEYTEMEITKGNESDLKVEDDDEFYVDVEAPPPARPPKGSTTGASASSTHPKPIPSSSTKQAAFSPVTKQAASSPFTKQVAASPTKNVTSSPSTKQTSSFSFKQTSPSSSTPSKVSSSFTPVKPSPPPSARTLESPISSQSTAQTTASRKVAPTAKPGGVGGGSKVASLSKMFGGTVPEQQSSSHPAPHRLSSSSSQEPTHSGSLMYKSSSRKIFATEWCVLTGHMLSFHSSQSDKVSHYRVSIRDATLQLGSHEGKGSLLSFFLMRGSTIHQFQANKKEDLVGWIAALVSVVKEITPSEDSVYISTVDREGKGDGQLSFKSKQIIWVIHRDGPTWTGILGKTPKSFTGSCGQFPAGDVQQYHDEDTYF